MADVTIPAQAKVDSAVDANGFPLLDLSLTLAPEWAEVALPGGPDGERGPIGRPRATFVKMGTLANVGARPVGLTADDRGKWWHRLDDTGMDVWCGDHWSHSPNAVGVTGPAAPANVLAPLPVLRDETYTVAAVKVRGGTAAEQTIEYTVPAGARGSRGVAGASGVITESPDYDNTYGAVHRSVFAWNRNLQRFRATTPPNGYGPYHFGSSSFNATDSNFMAVDQVVAAKLDIPAMPFDYRPMVQGMLRTATNANNFLYTFVRMNSQDGQIVGISANPVFNTYLDCVITSFFGDPQAQRVGPANGYAVIPAYQAVSFYVMVERQSTSIGVNYVQDSAWLNIWCQPVTQNVRT